MVELAITFLNSLPSRVNWPSAEVTQDLSGYFYSGVALWGIAGLLREKSAAILDVLRILVMSLNIFYRTNLSSPAVQTSFIYGQLGGNTVEKGPESMT